MKLTINTEYARRHLFVVVLMTGLGCWFGYDGFVRYPKTPAAELYKSIEGSDAPANINLEAFKKQKTQTQYGFTLLSLLAAAIVGINLLRSKCFDFAFDENGFSANGNRYAYTDIQSVDRTLWEKKGILKIKLPQATVTLDAWHHIGVKDFEKKIAGES